MRLRGIFEGGGWRFLPRGGLHHLHQFKDDALTTISRFVDNPTVSFDVTGVDPVADSALANVGLSAEYGPNMLLYLDYTAALGDEQKNLLSGGLAWRF
jgi:outer membrane autotransporter protein